jgi:acylglycerol lipase
VPTPSARHLSLAPTAATGALHLHLWEPTAPPRASLLIVHGYLEHGGRYAALGQALAARGIRTAAVDLRGQGRSAGRAGYIEQFEDYAADVEQARQQLPADVPLFLLGHSNGGLVALQLAQRHVWAGLILTNPFLAQTHPAPLLKRWVGQLAGRLWPPLALPAGIPVADLSRDPEMQAAAAADPFMQTHATAGWYREATAAQARLRQLDRVDLPLLYIYSDADPVADPTANARLAKRLQSPDKTICCRAGERHEVLQEMDRQALFAQLADWMLSRGAP